MFRIMGSAAALLVLGGLVLAGTWERGVPGGGHEKEDVDCGGIDGIAGEVDPFAEDVVGETFGWYHGGTGGEWVGQQFLDTNPAPVTVPDFIYHIWVKDGGGNATASTLQALTSSENFAGGSCAAIMPEDWWWIPDVDVTQEAPEVQIWDDDEEDWLATGWTDTESYEQVLGEYHSNRSSGQYPVPEPSGAGGLWRATFTFPPSPHLTLYRVAFPFETLADTTCDNALVNDWYELMHIDTLTAVSDEAYDDTCWAVLE